MATVPHNLTVLAMHYVVPYCRHGCGELTSFLTRPDVACSCERFIHSFCYGLQIPLSHPEHKQPASKAPATSKPTSTRTRRETDRGRQKQTETETEREIRRETGGNHGRTRLLPQLPMAGCPKLYRYGTSSLTKAAQQWDSPAFTD